MDIQIVIFIVQIIICLIAIASITFTSKTAEKRESQMMKTLEWYEDTNHYDSTPFVRDIQDWDPPEIFRDRGFRARTTIEALKRRDVVKGGNERFDDDSAW